MKHHRHVIVTRFAVPRPVPGTAELYRSTAWLNQRLRLFRRFYVPSVAGLGVPAVLLCAQAVADFVAERVADLGWARVVVQDQWHGGWPAATDQWLTRLDSDDALHRGWFAAIGRAPQDAEVLITRRFLRWDLAADRLHAYRRREPAPLAAFRAGANPYRVDHKHLAEQAAVYAVPGCYLLQIAHGANVSNHRPAAWRLDRRRSKHRLAPFGVQAPLGVNVPG